jgi:CRP-like cAMP-binding protein
MSPSNWPRNRLLLALPACDLKQLLPELEYIRCQREQILLDAGSSLDSIFFLDSGLISVLAVYSDGGTIEMATIGREGCTGVQAVFGAKNSSARFLVQIPGSAAKMSRAAFNRPMGSVPSLRNLMYGYVHAFLEQLMVSGACNGAHSLRQRLARWLRIMRDRSDGDELPITQNFLASKGRPSQNASNPIFVFQKHAAGARTAILARPDITDFVVAYVCRPLWRDQ